MSADDGFPPPTEAGADGASLDALYRSYREPLVSFLEQRLPEKSVAADITHAVFAKLAGAGAQSIKDARKYLFRAARNQLADYYRAKGIESLNAEQYAADPIAQQGASALSPEEETIRRDKLDRLRIIINAMPEKRRAVFLLARFQELTETEIAARLGMTRAGVRKHVSRAMRDCEIGMNRLFDEAEAEAGATRTRNGRRTQKR